MQRLPVEHRHSVAQTLVFALLLHCSVPNHMAAIDSDPALRWLSKAGPIPDLQVPPSRGEWESQRLQIRAQLWQLLGNLPPRPIKPDVSILSREDRGRFTVEKFRFDNGAG